MHCRIDPHYYKCDWLNGTGGGTDTAGNVFEMYTVEVDGGWGPCKSQPYRHESLFGCVRMPSTRTNLAMQQLPCHARMTGVSPLLQMRAAIHRHRNRGAGRVTGAHLTRINWVVVFQTPGSALSVHGRGWPWAGSPRTSPMNL